MGPLEIEAELDQQVVSAVVARRRAARRLGGSGGGPAPRSPGPVRSSADRGGRARPRPARSKAARWTASSRVEIGVGGQAGQQQVRRRHQGADAFRPERRERVEGFLDRGGAVVDAGDEVTVEVGEERPFHSVLMRQRSSHASLQPSFPRSSGDHRPTHPRLPRVGDPRHDPARAGARLHQPGPGLPQLSRAGAPQGGGGPRDSRRTSTSTPSPGARSGCAHALARSYAERYGLDVDPEREITVTCGATEAMIATLLAMVNPGDEVIVFEPFYENYGPDTILADARPVYVPLEPGQPLDLDRLAAAFTRPHPRDRRQHAEQSVGPGADARGARRRSRDLCVEHDALAVTDEIYEHIRYDGEHIPIATLPGMRERTVTISGASKTFSVTGWRIGWIVAPAELTDAIRKVHDFLTVGAPAPLQEGVAVALERAGRPTSIAGWPRVYRAPARPAARRAGRGGIPLHATGGRLLHPGRLRGARRGRRGRGAATRRHRVLGLALPRGRRDTGAGLELLPRGRRADPGALRLLQDRGRAARRRRAGFAPSAGGDVLRGRAKRPRASGLQR